MKDLKIEIPPVNTSTDGYVTLYRTDWDKHSIQIAEHNKMLSEGVVLKGSKSSLNNGYVFWDSESGRTSSDTHTMLGINIQPIKKETAEDVLRDLLKDVAETDWGDTLPSIQRYAKRAKAVLEEK